MQNKGSVVLTFRDVTFGYGPLPVIKEVNFTVREGERIGIIGPNGGGKTTALKLILRLIKPDRGVIRTVGSIGYVPQQPEHDSKFPITVREMVLTGAMRTMNLWGVYPRAIRRRADELLALFSLSPFRDRSFGTLSGGQVQKALIVRALIADPSILLLDEPTANIDRETEADIFSFLETLKGNRTVLIVTHNFDAIIRYGERILCFRQTVSSMRPRDICKHFSLGIYHPVSDATEEGDSPE
ncbi:MAG: ATP-binding cassette domain-containing protein [Simkaniaceae bacterium]|nr:ATP-binding cassette domain-containing protein [Simkaniaceae bacterium]